MTVTDITPDPTTDPTEALVGRIVTEIRAALVTPDLGAVHQVIREAGIRNARRTLAEAPDRLAEAQNAYREAQAVEAAAKDRYSQALVEVEWELDGQLHKDGNKTYRWVTCECLADADFTQVAGRPDCPVCAGAGKFRRFMLADDVKSWKAAEAARMPAVVVVAAELRRAEEDTAAARDALSVADKRLSAAKYEVQAAIAELNALAVGLASKENAR